MANLIVLVIIASILFFAIRTIIRANKLKGDEPGCIGCSSKGCSSSSKSKCNGCK